MRKVSKKEYTGYKDCNGNKVYVGDKIDFTWWKNVSPYGEIEEHHIGTIRKIKRGLAFRCYCRYYMLSDLRFSSEADWRLIK